ncbi:uncharacterized protein PG986_000346 [Apiospora aurea]|uniref:Uncharacterized protein n=1 Tax=Apiospora aurea TaxID=335848 RepID=A0ABR1QTU3_9PEZI
MNLFPVISFQSEIVPSLPFIPPKSSELYALYRNTSDPTLYIIKIAVIHEKSIQNQWRDEIGYWDTKDWADDVGDRPDILVESKSCVVFRDRPAIGTCFILIGNEEVVTWIAIVLSAFGSVTLDGEEMLAGVGQANCAGTTLVFEVAGLDP